MKSLILSLGLTGLLSTLFAQPSQQVTIDSCYVWAHQQYPVIKRAALIDKSNNYTIANIQKGYLPQIAVFGQATYQSEVTNISFPGVTIQPLSKDQYRTGLEVTQILLDGGSLASQNKVAVSSAALAQADLEKELYQIRERINQLFFGTILLQKQLEQNQILITNLTETKNRVDATILNGAAFRSDAEKLQVEILLQTQHREEIEAGIDAFREMLQVFTGKVFNRNTVFLLPDRHLPADTVNLQRPELRVFELRNNYYNSQYGLLAAKNKPHVSLFLQGGYGRPGLNQLKNEFNGFYLGGLKLNWNLGNAYTLKNEKSLLDIRKKENDIQQETFLFNNRLNRIQENITAKKNAGFLQTDTEIIRLKESIRASDKVKYENGVITLNDYLKEINAVSQARLNREMHNINLIINEYAIKNTLGK